jgi:hypothetical protein
MSQQVFLLCCSPRAEKQPACLVADTVAGHTAGMCACVFQWAADPHCPHQENDCHRTLLLPRPHARRVGQVG